MAQIKKTIREELADLIKARLAEGVPLVEMQSALDSEKDIVDKKVKAQIEAEQKAAKKKGKV